MTRDSRPPGTALVTGASAGLGVHFAHALAARGHGLILTARRAPRLEALAEELRERHGVAVAVIPADLGAPGAVAALIGGIARRGLAVNLLVNNAGFGLNGAFAELDGAGMRDDSLLARIAADRARAAPSTGVQSWAMPFNCGPPFLPTSGHRMNSINCGILNCPHDDCRTRGCNGSPDLSNALHVKVWVCRYGRNDCDHGASNAAHHLSVGTRKPGRIKRQ